VKKGIFFLVAVAAVFSFATSAFAIDIFFENRESREISRGVVYEQNRMMTARGMVDAHLLFVNLDEPYITLAPVASQDVGLRETTSRLLSNAGAVAGINADFFNMARLHSTYFGPMVRDGQLLSLNPRHDMGTFFLDMNNNPFFKYMQTTMRLYVDGVHRITNVAGYNSIGPEINAPKVVSRAAMNDTASIDARISDTTKFIVVNNTVVRVSAAGETVQTPENGFVIIVPASSREHYMNFFTVGRRVDFNISTDLNVDFSSIQAAIGGGAVILANGELVEGGGIEPNRRHPRTAVGATRDGRIVLVTVDGRTHSVGVTHAELGAILQRYGVVNAMHMDGGGSTTMVTRSSAGAYSVANTLSDGSQRRVTNALGVFNNSPVGEPIGIIVEPVETRAVAGVPMPVNIFLTDTYGNKIPIEKDIPLNFIASTTRGFWSGGQYTPLNTGSHTLEVWYGDFRATTEIEVFSLAELQPRNRTVNLLEGGSVLLQFSGTTTDGTQVNIPEVTGLTVTPAHLGIFEDGHFIAQRGGTGYISAVVGAIRAYIPVTVGGFPWPIDMFASPMDFLSTPPEYVFTRVTRETAAERDVIRLDYNFGRTAQTQASYVTFYPALAIPGEPIALRMDVYGDDSGHWLRGRVRDGEGNLHNIDFARNVNFTGWQTVTARLPSVPAPFTIDRIYMVSTESFDFSRHTVIFAQLEALYLPNEIVPVPQGTVFNDRLRVDASATTGLLREFVIPTAADEIPFSVVGTTNFVVTRMSARNGGIQATDIEQWQKFMPTIRAFPQHRVVILLDESPLNFTRRMEYELFHLAMTQLRDEGRIVFVVSATANETTLTMRDNIRYINMAQPKIAFRTEGDRTWWQG
jgi:exopolysaccharide biosynthesis protein